MGLKCRLLAASSPVFKKAGTFVSKLGAEPHAPTAGRKTKVHAPTAGRKTKVHALAAGRKTKAPRPGRGQKNMPSNRS